MTMTTTAMTVPAKQTTMPDEDSGNASDSGNQALKSSGPEKLWLGTSWLGISKSNESWGAPRDG